MSDFGGPLDEMKHMYDCIVVGGGPAGLTAAIYLGRYHLKVLVFDDGRSRAAIIPLARNHAGYPNGICGRELLRRMRIQAESFGAEFISSTVIAITKEAASFEVRSAALKTTSRAILLANGVVNHQPEMPDSIHTAAVAHGFVRYCPICDAYEITD